jgi:hypothetical protein
MMLTTSAKASPAAFAPALWLIRQSYQSPCGILLHMAHNDSSPQSNKSLWLLVIPVLALIFPTLYNRETPTLFGFPFFYWYQLAWVFLATAVLGLVYMLRKN